MESIIKDIMGNNFTGELTSSIIFFRLLLAVIFGGLVGLEREKKNRPAGFRTHILVCLGATVISIIEDQLRIDLFNLALANPELNGVNTINIGRLGAQVITGIGFLGAGSIMKDKGENVGGLTTAAGIWATGCVGLGIGWGFYNITFMALFFVLLVMISLKKVERKLIRKNKTIIFEVKCVSDDVYSAAILECYEVFSSKGIRILEIEKDIEENKISFSVNVRRSDISRVITELSKSSNIEYVKDI